MSFSLHTFGKEEMWVIVTLIIAVIFKNTMQVQKEEEKKGSTEKKN